jgi:uncharacterized protein YjbI with pentapeptide repeats
MAKNNHVELIKKGATAWNEWRDKNPEIVPDLCATDLGDARLSRANLSKADLPGTASRELNLVNRSK